MKAIPAICGDHLVPISECDCVNYLQDLIGSAQRLVQLTKERESLEPTINDIKKVEEESK